MLDTALPTDVSIGNNTSENLFNDTSENRSSDAFNNSAFEIPEELRFNSQHVLSLCAYSVLFVFSAIGNVTMLLILLRNLRKAKLNRVYTLLLNLNAADLMVTFIHMPQQIIHNALVQWYGPEWLCKFLKYMDVFAIYLSSHVLICLSLDRFFAIVRPLYSFTASRHVKIMIVVSWFVAALSSTPQVYTWCKASPPNNTWYTQCISFPQVCGTEFKYIIINTILNALEIYILPFMVILFCYGAILAKILQEAKYASEVVAAKNSNVITSKMSLRRSSYCYIRRAKSKTLRMTIVIVITFLVCWTPYFVMTSVFFADTDLTTGASRSKQNLKPHPAVEKLLYIFAVFNSCINPYLYGYYSFKLKSELRALYMLMRYYFLACVCPGRNVRERGRYMRTFSGEESVARRGTARTSRGLSLDLTNAPAPAMVNKTSLDQSGSAGTGANTSEFRRAASSIRSNLTCEEYASDGEAPTKTIAQRLRNRRNDAHKTNARVPHDQMLPPRLLVNSREFGDAENGEQDYSNRRSPDCSISDC